MNNKILILVNCPVLEKTYEIFVPVGKKIGTVINLIIKAINELSSQNTLDESILTTIKRDLKLIYYKLKYVLNPFSSPLDKRFHLNNWDLWGPLLFITFLSCILSIPTR